MIKFFIFFIIFGCIVAFLAFIVDLIRNKCMTIDQPSAERERSPDRSVGDEALIAAYPDRLTVFGKDLLQHVDLLSIGLYKYLSDKYIRTMSVEEAGIFAAGMLNFLFDKPQQRKLDLIKVKREAYLLLDNNNLIRELVVMGLRVAVVADFMLTGKPQFPPRGTEILSKYGHLYPGSPNPNDFMKKVTVFVNTIIPRSGQGKSFNEPSYVDPLRIPPLSANLGVIANFSRYCRLYLSQHWGLSERQAQLLLLDPQLGKDMDNTKKEWIIYDLSPQIDIDQFLVPPRFDAPEMRRINELLDYYALSNGFGDTK